MVQHSPPKQRKAEKKPNKTQKAQNYHFQAKKEHKPAHKPAYLKNVQSKIKGSVQKDRADTDSNRSYHGPEIQIFCKKQNESQDSYNSFANHRRPDSRVHYEEVEQVQ
jgi:hypothetical protein